jgi:hypothetical protein
MQSILIYACLILSLSASAQGRTLKWQTVDHLPPLKSLEAKSVQSFYACAPQLGRVLVLDASAEIIHSSASLGTRLQGFSSLAEIDARDPLRLYLVNDRQLCRLDPALRLQGCSDLMENEWLSTPDLLAQSSTEDLLVAESHTGQLIQVDAFGEIRFLLEESDLPEPLRLASFEVLHSSAYLLHRESERKTILYHYDLFNEQLYSLPLKGIQSIHRNLEEHALLLFEADSLGSRVATLQFDPASSEAARSLPLFDFPALPAGSLPRDFLLFDQRCFLLLEDGSLLISSIDKACID